MSGLVSPVKGELEHRSPQVNLAIVGGQKCGTTALADFIAQHPDIFVVNGKEGHIFDAPDIDELSVKDIDFRYSQILQGYGSERYICDATPIYSYWQDIPPRLRNYNADFKVIFLLRDPVDRAVSQYFMEKNRGDEHLNILSAFLSETKRLSRDQGNRVLGSSWRHHSYLDRGLYSEQISNLKKNFAPENILIMTNSELRYQHQEALIRVFSFLGINNVNISGKNVFEGKYNADEFIVKVARVYALLKLRNERKLFRQYELNRGRTV